MTDDMRLLILTHLRAALERRDWRAVERAYVLAGGMGSGEPGKAAERPKISPSVGVWDVVA
jgi:hypothetical protein